MATKRVSIDEFLGSRKGFVTDDGILLKAAKAPSSFDAEKGTCRFVMSTEAPDRDRDVVLQAGLDLTEFMKNPVAPFGHRSADFPIGAWEDLSKNLAGRPKRTEGTLRLTEGDPVAERLRIHLAAGTVRACSIGFMPKEIERRTLKDGEDWTGFLIAESELYECSPVAIPAQPQALAKAAESNGLLPKEVIEEILDTWTMQDGLIVPRKAFEDAHRDAGPAKSTVVFSGKTFEVKAGSDGAPVLQPVEPSEAERIADAIEKDESVLSRIAKALGLKGKTETADPAPEQDGKKPAPDPTPEQKLKADLSADLPALAALHDRIERRNAIAERHADIEARLSA
jgi:HK97 family phage prohead protease